MQRMRKIGDEALMTEIVDALQSGVAVKFPGVGKLYIRDSKARMGRNPRTRESIQIPAKRKVVFKASKELNGIVNA